VTACSLSGSLISSTQRPRWLTDAKRLARNSAALDVKRPMAHPQLSREMKLALLRQWEQTARSLSVAESEGMGGGEENKLGRVELAIALVEKQP
jgi:hypothetical protein